MTDKVRVSFILFFFRLVKGCSAQSLGAVVKPTRRHGRGHGTVTQHVITSRKFMYVVAREICVRLSVPVSVYLVSRSYAHCGGSLKSEAQAVCRRTSFAVPKSSAVSMLHGRTRSWESLCVGVHFACEESLEDSSKAGSTNLICLL